MIASSAGQRRLWAFASGFVQLESCLQPHWLIERQPCAASLERYSYE